MDQIFELEQEARRLRDIIYMDTHGPISDESWNNIKALWIDDIGWLRQNAQHAINKQTIEHHK